MNRWMDVYMSCQSSTMSSVDVLVDGRQVLSHACLYKKPDIALELLRNGADFTIVDEDDQRTPLMNAIINELDDVAKYIIQYATINHLNAIDENGCTALYFACIHKNADIAIQLLRRDVDFTIADEDGSTPLMWAIENGLDVVVNYIIQHATMDHLNVYDFIGMTALHCACCDKKTNIALQLLQKGVDFTIADKDGKTPLMIAIENGMTDVFTKMYERSKN